MFRGELMVFDGRSYVVVGMDPVGVTPRLVYLEDFETNEWRSVAAETFVADAHQRLRLILGGEFEPAN
jgi:hypothetical protein